MNYVTLFNDAYLAKGLTMIRSLLKHHPNSKVYVLNCGSELVERALQLMPPGVQMLHDKSLMAFVSLRGKHGNSPTYYWAAASIWTSYIQRAIQDAVCYVDADLFFFDNADRIRGGTHIAIIPHRWSPHHAQRLKVNGTYNVGWVYFDYTEIARSCLINWATQCLTWCENKAMADGRFADQGYLNNWPTEWNAHEVTHLGANLAPWNQEQYYYYTVGNHLYISPSPAKAGYPLLFYHFHEFKWRDGNPFYTHYPIGKEVKEHVYDPYIDAYRRSEADVSTLG